MIKILNKVGLEGMYLNITKATHDNPTTNVILSGEKVRAFPQDQEQNKDFHPHYFYSA